MSLPRGCIAALCLAAAAGLSAQEKVSELKERYITLDITTRVEESGEELGNETSSRTTLSGRPVNFKIKAGNVVIDIQLTPYVQGAKGRQNLLVAQGQVLVNVPNVGASYKSTVQTIPLDFGEEIFFFPLGSAVSANPRIEMKIVMRRYEDPQAAPKDAPQADPQDGPAPKDAAAEANGREGD